MKKIMIRLIILVSFILVGCDNTIHFNNLYSATLYDNVNHSMNEDFFNKHITEDSKEADWNYLEMDLPKNYTILIENQDRMKEIFIDNSFEIEFDSQVGILYIFTCQYVHTCKLASTIINDDTLDVKLKMVFPSGATGSVCVSYTRCMLVIMNKVEVDSIVINIE